MVERGKNYNRQIQEKESNYRSISLGRTPNVQFLTNPFSAKSSSVRPTTPIILRQRASSYTISLLLCGSNIRLRAMVKSIHRRRKMSSDAVPGNSTMDFSMKGARRFISWRMSTAPGQYGRIENGVTSDQLAGEVQSTTFDVLDDCCDSCVSRVSWRSSH